MTSQPKTIVFDRIAFGAFIITVGLLPLFIIPNFLLSLDVGKTLFLALGTIVALISYLIARLVEGSFSYPKTWFCIGILAFVATVFLSAAFSSAPYTSFVGLAFDSGTFANILFLGILFFIGALTAGSPRRVVLLYEAIVSGAILLGALQTLSLLLQRFHLIPKIAAALGTGTIGSLNDTAIYFGLIALISMLALEQFHVHKKMRVLAQVALVLSLFLLAVIHFTLVWAIIGFIALLAFVYGLIAKRVMTGNHDQDEKFPVVSFVIVLIALLFLLAGPLVSSGINAVFPVSNNDIRPSLGATMQVAGKEFLHNPVFGIGPNRFSEVWGKYRPSQVVTSSFWDASFVQGFGFVPSIMATDGGLASIAILFVILAAVWLGIKKVFIFSRDAKENVLLLMSFITTLYLWLFAILYPSSSTVIGLTFAMSGVFVGLLVSYGLVPTKTVTYLDDPRKSFFSILSIVLILLATIAGGYAVIERGVAVAYLDRGISVFSNYGDIQKAETRISISLALAKTEAGYSALSQVAGADLNRLLNTQGLSQDAVQQQFQGIFQTAQAADQGLISMNKDNPSYWITLGNLYQTVVPLGVKGAYDNAKSAYQQAQTITPNDPSIYVALAQLEIANNDTQAASDDIAKALAIKPNYTDAVFVSAGLSASAGDLATAITQIKTATVFDPYNPTVFFQLGLLEYNNKDYPDARDAFLQAVNLDPTYLNARYFYGITLAKLGDTETAVTVFQALVKLLPQNQEVAQVLSNIQNGLDPLAGIATSDTTSANQNLPIAEPAPASDATAQTTATVPAPVKAPVTSNKK